MFFVTFCMVLQLAMCFPDKPDPLEYYKYDDIDTDKVEGSAVSAKREIPTRSHLRLFKGQVFNSVTEKPKRILDWRNFGVSKDAPMTPTRSSMRKYLGPQELDGIKEALRQMMPHRKFDDSSSVSPTSAFEDTSTLTPWFTMRNAEPSTPSTGVSSITPADKAQEDLVSLKVATEYQDTPAPVDVRTMYDERITEAAIYYDTNNIARQRSNPNDNTTTTLTTLTPTTITTTVTIKKTKRSKRRRTTTPKTTTQLLDIEKLLEVIANLTQDYSINLAMMLNKSLERYSIPTCPTISEQTTTQETVVTTDAFANLTGTIMGKCFVCGLNEIEIPRLSQCADAFSGDFLPLLQVDATARGQIGRYRKYCRWMNVPKYEINATDPRNMWGRWTGGCSVRWIDLNGLYTQRTCRNRHRAVMGQHFISKRMAKLEMALQHIDDGCIISPVASLVPISRGISLYARFHACVCSGNWCNLAPSYHQWTTHIILFPIIMKAILKF